MDRFIEALIKIREEINLIEKGVYKIDDNPLINAPHTIEEFMSENWKHCYSKQEAAFPLPWIKERGKFWAPTSRGDEVYGDTNF